MAAPTQTYAVTLHHLAPGAVAAGAAYPDEQLPAVPVGQLRDLLYALSEVAARLTIYEPSNPEIRIKTDREAFVVRTRYRRLCFVGYETALRGEEHSVAHILTTITGTAEPTKTTVTARPERAPVYTAPTFSPSADGGRVPRWAKITAMAVIILTCNGVAAWMLLRPPETLTPQYTLMTPVDSVTLLTRAAGEYRTGSSEGDRRVIIDSTGNARLSKLGPNQTSVQSTTKTIRGALVGGQPALITSDAGAIMIQDPDTITMFGNTYKRHNP